MSEIKERASAAVFTPNRLEFLTDGVFAIVMTLLVLDITIPEITQPSLQAELPRKLLELGPKLWDYTMSFINLGILWGYHHLAFHSIKRSDIALVWLNIVFLMFVALIPFSTAIQSAPPIKPDPVSTFIHSLNMALAVAMLFIIWTYATGKHRLVDSDISPLIVKVYKLITIGSLLFFVLSVGISFINAEIASLVPVPVGVAVIVMQFKYIRMLRRLE